MIMNEYVKRELSLLIVMLYGLGMILKDTKITDKYIPMTLTVAGILLANLYIIGVSGFSALNIFSGIVQGILCAATSVYGNQLLKQFKK